MMNTRIQTLLAKFKETESTHRGAECLAGLDEIEKFAELIVRECLGTCSKQAADWEGEYADAHNDGVGSCISGIKEHFGVEWELNDVS